MDGISVASCCGLEIGYYSLGMVSIEALWVGGLE